MTVGAGSRAHGSNAHVKLPGHDLYRQETVASYYSRPRGYSTSLFAPEYLQPQWRWVAIALAVLVLTVLAGLLVQVPAGPVGTLVGINQMEAVIALPSASVAEPGTEVRLNAGGTPLRGTVGDVEPGASALLNMVLIELTGDAPPEDLAIGSPVILEAGHRPLLVDVLEGGSGA